MDALVLEILKYAQRHDLDSSVVVLACAEVLAITAVALDTQAGALSRTRIEERLHDFEARVLARYAARMQQRAQQLAIPRV
jgi:hypothetical protein